MYYISKTAEIRGNLVVSAEEIGRLRALSSSSFKGGREEGEGWGEKREMRNFVSIIALPPLPPLPQDRGEARKYRAATSRRIEPRIFARQMA